MKLHSNTKETLEKITSLYHGAFMSKYAGVYYLSFSVLLFYLLSHTMNRFLSLTQNTTVINLAAEELLWLMATWKTIGMCAWQVMLATLSIRVWKVKWRQAVPTHLCTNFCIVSFINLWLFSPKGFRYSRAKEIFWRPIIKSSPGSDQEPVGPLLQEKNQPDYVILYIQLFIRYIFEAYAV